MYQVGAEEGARRPGETGECWETGGGETGAGVESAGGEDSRH